MGLTVLPGMPIPLSLARDWSTYRKNLDSTPLVDRYLADTLQQWVQNPQILNPLVLPGIRILVDGSLNSLERHLAELEQAMGESALSKLLSDLLRKQGPAMDIQRDISALFGEIMAFRRLKEMGARDIAKITSKGDWLADGVTVSVKTVLARLYHERGYSSNHMFSVQGMASFAISLYKLICSPLPRRTRWTRYQLELYDLTFLGHITVVRYLHFFAKY